MKRFLYLFCFLFLFGNAGKICLAQNERVIEEQKLSELRPTEETPLAPVNVSYFDYGAWLDLRYSSYIDNDNNREAPDALRDSIETDLRVWWKAVYRHLSKNNEPREHGIYLRLKDLYYTDYPEEEIGDYDHEGPSLDLGYLTFDYNPLKIEAGRRYFNLGAGIAYGDVHDGVQLSYFRHPWHIGLFTSHTLPHENNIDTSVPGYDKNTDRLFTGAGLGYTGFKNFAMYGYYLKQTDFTNEVPPESDQQYVYNSSYLGLGMKADIDKKMHLWMEIIRSFGQSYTYPVNDKAKINAWALNMGFEYYWDMPSQPRVTLEYAFGSGDSDRDSVTNTINGNLSEEDNNFLYFGYFYSGYVLAPRLSNIHIYRLSHDFKPLSRIDKFKRLTLVFDYFYFLKQNKKGGISDPQAVNAKRDLGHEIDLHLNWQFLSDLRFGLDFGYFMPGEAFADDADDPEKYFGSRVTLTF